VEARSERATCPTGVDPRMPTARPSTAPSKPLKCTWPRRRGRASRGSAGCAPLRISAAAAEVAAATKVSGVGEMGDEEVPG